MKKHIKKATWLTGSLIIGAILFWVVFNNITITVRQPFEGDLYAQANLVRAMNDIPELKHNDELYRVAQARCDDMVKRNYFDHKDPDGKYTYQAYNLNFTWTGENLAEKYANSDEVVDGWMNSPTHKTVLLTPKYTEVGYGVCWTGEYYKVVQILRG